MRKFYFGRLSHDHAAAAAAELEHSSRAASGLQAGWSRLGLRGPQAAAAVGRQDQSAHHIARQLLRHLGWQGSAGRAPASLHDGCS